MAARVFRLSQMRQFSRRYNLRPSGSETTGQRPGPWPSRCRTGNDEQLRFGLYLMNYLEIRAPYRPVVLGCAPAGVTP